MNPPQFQKSTTLDQAKQSARVELDKHEQRVLKSLALCSETRRLLEKDARFLPFVPLWNAVQYCSVADLDLSILVYQVMIAETGWRRNLNARLLAMTLVECVEDIGSVLGKDFQNTASVILNGNKHLEELRLIRSSISEFRKDHERMLREIRNSAAAYRDKDADLQMVVINSTNAKNIWELSRQFLNHLDRFTKLMTLVFVDLKKSF